LEIIERDQKVLSPCNWRYIPLVVKSGKDVFLEDVDGNVYLDFVAGAACHNVGIQNQRIIEAIKEQMEELVYMAVPGYFYHKIVVDFAEKLCEITPGSFDKKVFFGLSGADATDTAMKMAHHYTGRQRFIAFIGCNHGLGTYGGTSLSGLNPTLVRGFSPILAGVTHIPYPYGYRCVFGCDYPECGQASLRFLEDCLFKTVVPPDEVAGIFVEPIQGDGGVLVPPDDFLPGLQEICRKYRIPLIVDEVQTGYGRTGKMFASEHWGIEPDITLLAKPMASGLPVSCVVARSEIADLEKGSHAITAAGHFLGCAAGLATINEIVERKLPENAVEVGDYMQTRLKDMMKDHQVIGEVRGRGLLIGVEIVKDRKFKTPGNREIAMINRRAFEKGLVTAYDGLRGNVFRLMPSLTLTKEWARVGLDILEESFRDLERGLIQETPSLWQ
jgi:4-aminobutyrate aminotransferase